jgi:hypothetical protein
MMGFVGEYPVPGTPAAATFLATNLGDACLLGCHRTCAESLDFIQQQAPGEKPVESLLPRCLAFDLQTRWTMAQHDASGGLVDVLTAVPG